MEHKNISEISWRTCMKLGLAAIVVYLIIRYWSGLESFIVLLFNGITALFAGFIIAYVINIPMRFFERKLPGDRGDGTRNRLLSLILAVACIILGLVFVLLLVIPGLVDAVITLSRDLPTSIEAIMSNDFIASLIPASFMSYIEGIDWDSLIAQIASWLQSGVVNSLPQIATLFGQIGSWIMGFVLSFWFLSEKDKLCAQIHRLITNYLGPDVDRKCSMITSLFDDCFRGYITAQVTEAFIFGCMVAAMAFVFGIPEPLMLGSLVCVMSLIPMVGAYIGAILGAIIILATSWQKAVLFLIVFFITLQIEVNFVYSRVVGGKVGLSGMWPLIGVTLGATLFGIVGALTGVPITAAIFRMVETDLDRREKLPENTPTPFNKLQKKLSDSD